MSAAYVNVSQVLALIVLSTRSERDDSIPVLLRHSPNTVDIQKGVIHHKIINIDRNRPISLEASNNTLDNYYNERKNESA